MYSTREIVIKAPIENIIGEQPYLDLSNYFPKHHSFNSIVYFHKKFLAKHSDPCIKRDENKYRDVSTNIPSEKVTNRPVDSKNKHDRSQNHSKIPRYVKDKRKHKEINGSLVQQTITFAKNIVPLILPPSVERSHDAYYTVKSVKPKKTTTKENIKTFKEQKREYVDTKPCIETFRKDTCFRESSTAMETTSRLSSLQELKLSGTLNCSLSEISNRPNKKKRQYNRENTSFKANTPQDTKLVVSESLQALADGLNQSVASANQIKLHVMTEQDKALLTEGVRDAVIRAVRDCVDEITKCKAKSQELVTMQKTVKYNSNKLDNIINRLSSIEIGIANAVKEKSYMKPIDTETKVLLRHNPKEANTSTLEQLGEDLLEQDISDGENNVETFNSYDNRRPNVHLDAIKVTAKDIENQGHGEDVPKPGISSAEQFDEQQERTNRIPTRYCWTDVNSRRNRP